MPLSSAVSQRMARERCPINTRDAEFMECNLGALSIEPGHLRIQSILLNANSFII
jgi:hypothetical protein